MSHNRDFLLQFGNIDFFRAMLDEGFTSVACGVSQQYQDGFRIAALFAFYKSADAPRVTEFVQVPTWQVKKEKALGDGEGDYAVPAETRYSEAALAEFLKRRRMNLGVSMDLGGVLCAMETQAIDERLVAAS